MALRPECSDCPSFIALVCSGIGPDERPALGAVCLEDQIPTTEIGRDGAVISLHHLPRWNTAWSQDGDSGTQLPIATL